ncbi:MAG TPA: VWA domain-containing protein [Verrucomicrobiota bacterium]|nr:VWA domain-containing protein [Verrucomicrobiota bacterium]
MDFAHPHFAEPQWLWLAVLGSVSLAALQVYAARRRRAQLKQIAAPGFVQTLTRSHSPLRRGIKNAMLLAAVAGIGIAMARPQWGVQHLETRELGEDLVFALDCSRSMLASDVSPNRLTRAKQAVLDFVRNHARGRVGLVAFAGQAFLQCPLTFDYDAFEDALRALDDKTIAVPGTDIGRALEEAFEAMSKEDQRKLIILLTDGEDLRESGVSTAESLAEKDVVVFTIGVGTTSGSEIMVINEHGQRELVRDEDGQVVRSRLDEATLQKIAEATGGRYYPLGALGEGLARVRLAVDTRIADAAGVPTQILGIDRFHVPLAVVLVLLVSESMLGTRRWKTE